MKYLKKFENINQYREIDLQQLWNDFTKYRKEIPGYGNYKAEVSFQHFLNKILLDKNVEFLRIKNPIDDEISYSYSGKIRSLFTSTFTKTFKIYVKMYNTEKYPTTRRRDLSYLLAEIYYYSNKPIIIKVQGDMSDDEKILEILKNTEKYNL